MHLILCLHAISPEPALCVRLLSKLFHSIKAIRQSIIFTQKNLISPKSSDISEATTLTSVSFRSEATMVYFASVPAQVVVAWYWKMTMPTHIAIARGQKEILVGFTISPGQNGETAKTPLLVCLGIAQYSYVLSVSS